MAESVISDGDVVIGANEPPRYGDGSAPSDAGGDIVLRTGGVERARIGADGVGRGLLGGSVSGLYAPGTAGAVLGSDLVAETIPRYAAAGSPVAPTAGTVYFHRIYLRAGNYTTVTLVKNVQGTTLTNSFLAVYSDNLGTQLSVSADLSATIAAVAAASAMPLPLATTIATEGWYQLAFLIGSAVAMPTYCCATTQLNALKLLAPQQCGVHNTAGLTAMPASLVSNPGSAGIDFYARYA